ncbi:hypothetical protein [Marinobacter mobilis]|uniref:Uncharacterized protein n=1 Tax=Marinobacter mobilis TaxID=488533 RepID=A0A1H2SY68_9GAMM|nr:hypothetical protein [Marinobacter mobilis]SDW36457.1 hypothetical protein SAMN04487960_102276 [Marinobacter mobilis]
MSTNTSSPAGTAPAAKLKKAGCGFRFSEGELQEGIDFSKANQLLPQDPEEPEAPEESAVTEASASDSGKQRQGDRHD